VTGGVVLDIGYAQMPNPYLRAHHRVGFDVAPAPDCDVRYEEHIQADVSVIRERLRERRFDTIICAELIEHLENPYQFLRDLHPLLAPEGRLILSTPNPVGLPVVLFEWLRSHDYFYTREHTYYFAPRWVERLLEGSGYMVTGVDAVGWWLPFGALGFCPASLSYQVIYTAGAR
jgi:SAM-dependent methyltransferase